jgi:hypothetical protein
MNERYFWALLFGSHPQHEIIKGEAFTVVRMVIRANGIGERTFLCVVIDTLTKQGNYLMSFEHCVHFCSEVVERRSMDWNLRS